jgi:hypothetical protein
VIPVLMRTTSSNVRACCAGFATWAATLGFDLVNRDTGEILHTASAYFEQFLGSWLASSKTLEI